MKYLLRYVVTFTVAMSLTNKSCEARPLVEHHVNHRRLKQARIRAIQQEILSKLGLTHVPDATKFNATVEEVRQMYKLYKKSLRDNEGRVHSLYSEEEFYAKKFHSFTSDGTPPLGSGSKHWQSASSRLLSFPVNIPLPREANRETLVHSASLKLYKLRTKIPPWWAENAGETQDADEEGLTTRINIYQLLEPGDTSKKHPQKRLLDSRLVPLEGSGWEVFNVKRALQDWLAHPGANYGLQIVCVTCVLEDTVEFALVDPAVESNDVLEAMREADLAPTLDVYTQDKLILGRQKRSQSETYDCNRGDGETRCCRYKLDVDFDEIGWGDWIIEPKGYQAYVCDGTCNDRYKSAHRFATIQSIMHQFNPAAAPSTCCTATKMKPLQLLHYNSDGGVEVSWYEDMIVTECKCA